MEMAAQYLPALAWVLTAASLLLAAFLGIILVYHWFRYAMNPAITGVAFIVYVVISSILLSGMFAAVAILTSSV
jgi:hypothetical protein